jgi:hypothetical protein
MVHPGVAGSAVQAHWPPSPEHSGSAQSILPSQLSSIPLSQISTGPHASAPASRLVEQAPLAHVWGGVHAVALPQFPVESHVSTALPEHVVAPGVHEPAQLPAVHTF